MGQNEGSCCYLTSGENPIFGKILIVEKKGKKGKSGRGSCANRLYLEFVLSDFDEILSEYSWYEKN